MTGFEPAASCSQSRRATNCATPGYSVYLSGWLYSPKPGAIPTSLYPDIQFLPLYHGERENQRFFCLWSFMWSKPLLCRFQQSGKVPQTQASQGFAAFRLALPRIPPRHSQTRRDTNFAIPGYFFSIPQLRVEGKRKFLVYINKVVIGGRLPADDDLIQICIKHLACCALRQREGDIRAEKVGVDGQVEAAAL